jgi:hypothetical protein
VLPLPNLTAGASPYNAILSQTVPDGFVVLEDFIYNLTIAFGNRNDFPYPDITTVTVDATDGENVIATRTWCVSCVAPTWGAQQPRTLRFSFLLRLLTPPFRPTFPQPRSNRELNSGDFLPPKNQFVDHSFIIDTNEPENFDFIGASLQVRGGSSVAGGHCTSARLPFGHCRTC